MEYQDARTGLTFAQVNEMCTGMHWLSRYVVLGKWREIKQDVWRTHLYYCEQEPEETKQDLIKDTKSGKLCVLR